MGIPSLSKPVITLIVAITLSVVVVGLIGYNYYYQEENYYTISVPIDLDTTVTNLVYSEMIMNDTEFHCASYANSRGIIPGGIYCRHPASDEFNLAIFTSAGKQRMDYNDWNISSRADLEKRKDQIHDNIVIIKDAIGAKVSWDDETWTVIKKDSPKGFYRPV